MDKILQIYTATDNKGGVQNFPYIDEEPLRIVDFSFSGSRMEIPTLTASVKHKECLDSKWNYKQFVEFRGEKYWVSKIPSSSKDNTDHRYKHDITFVSERNILSNIYFYDIVDAESESGKYHSNSSKVLFYGTISELVDRINASLKYSGIDYVVAIKQGEIPADKLAVTKEFSCENVFVFDALKQAFETWDIPFYFVGKNCYFGFGEELGKDSLKYGKNNGLLKIERTNGNTRIITRATGLGSTENIPFYYPNMSEKGDFTFTLKRKDGTIIPVEIIDQNKVATTIPDSVTYEFTDKSEYSNAYINTIEVQTAYGEPWKDFFLGDYVNVSLHDDPHSIRVWFTVDNFDNVIFDFRLNTENHGSFQLKDFKSISLYDAETNQPIQTWFGLNTSKITTDFKNGLSGSYYFLLSELDIFRGGDIIDEEYQYTFETVTISTVTSKEETTKIYKWIPKDVNNARNFTSLKYLGIDYVETEADLEGTFVMNIIPNSKVPYQERLMPSIFSRGTAFNGNVTATRGVERFYNAKNSTYPNIEFTNELNEFNRSENIYQYDDIKPSIAKVTNANSELIGQVLDVAFDKNDNDDVYGEEYGDKSNNYIHPYFYIKLHTFDGDLGFNLFNRATEKDSMTIQMTSGDLNGCKFKIQVIDKGNNVFANPVQVYTQADVDKEGSTITEDMIGQIVAGDSDKKISRSNFIESQQDTRKNEVWIAVLKDTETFGTILPSSVTNLVVKKGDTFNITGIHMPESYILAAEQWLDESIVSDMADENIEAFNFAIDFSRIFLQEDYETNKENSWVAKLTESVRIPVEYNGRAYQQYVTSYTYECKGAELLPKISVGLSNTIAKSESYADAIVKKSTTTITQSTPRIVKTQIANSNLAVKSNTLSGYGITDAKIEDDGTLVLGTASVVIPKETKSLDWSQITNKPDYFELDENGDVKVKGGKGLWTESFLSTKGASIDTGTGGDGSGGIGINAMWTELAREDSSRIIDYSHMPSSVKTAINWVSSVTGSDADSQINKWNEIISFLSGISDTSSLSSILSGKANASVVEELSDDVSALNSHITNILARKVNAGTGLSGGGTLNDDVTLSLATIGKSGTYTKVIVDAYGRVTGSSTLLESDIPYLSIAKISNLQSTIDTINGKFLNYLPLAGGKMANTNLVTNLNADLLDGYNADDLFKGRLKINSQISVSAEGWYTIASITTNGFNERGTIHFAIRTTGGDFRPYVTHYYINSSWHGSESNIFTNGIGGFITGIRLTQTGDSNAGGTRNIELCFSRDFTGYLIVLYSAYDNDGIINDNFTWNIGALPIADNSAEVWRTLDLWHGINTDKQIRTTNALYADSVVIGGVTLSWDYTNGMLKLDKGAYFLGPVSTKGVSNETGTGGTGGTGVDLSAVWDSLSKNTDIYGSTKIHLDHIPSLTKSKISDFPTLVSAFANDAGYITASAIINKADKETTIQGYGLWEKYTDLNEAPMGAFFCGGTSVANSPESGNYISGLTLAKDKNAQFRTQLGFVNNRIFTRQENGANNWSQWRELAFLGDVAKKATTLAGYGITDAVTLGTEQIVTGSKTFKNDGYYTSIFNSTLSDGKVRLLLMNNGEAKLMLAYDGLGSLLYDYGSAQTLRIQNDGDLLFTKSIIASSQLKSNVATGTAPLVVNSTTMVANLNANYLGGLNKDSFVQIGTDQTITGTKTFTANPIVNNSSARFTANNGSLSGFFGFSGNVIGAYSTSLAEWLISASTSAVCIAPQGKVNVGVKTWTPAYDFHVNGSIGANSLTIGQATISWDSVNGMLKVNTGAYFTGPVSTKGVSGGSGLVAVAQFGITWHDAWAIDANSTYVESFGTTNKSISDGQGTTNGSTIEIVSDAFSGKKIGDIEIFTLGWENEAPSNVRLAPYKISGNTLYCSLLLSGTMSQATFKIKIY